jgi:hypothetical protein
MVEKGNIRGRQKEPITVYMPKPDEEYTPEAQFLPEEFSFLAEPEDTDTGTDSSGGADSEADKPADTAGSEIKEAVKEQGDTDNK